MKKTEFPTFLNEQPTVVFGRTMRELLVILIGISLTYTVWTGIGSMLPGLDFGVLFLQIILAVLMMSATVVVALVKIASRPLEEWALVGAFYALTPKVFMYMPSDDGESIQELESSLRRSVSTDEEDPDE